MPPYSIWIMVKIALEVYKLPEMDDDRKYTNQLPCLNKYVQDE